MPEPRKTDLRPFLPEERDLLAFNWPLEKKIYGLVWFLLTFCPFWWLIDKREPLSPRGEQESEWNRRRANWVLGWTALLILLWLIDPSEPGWKVVVGVLAGLRLFEIYVTGLGTILHQRQQVRARNVVTILFYAIQVVLIFAILYHSFAGSDFLPKSGNEGPNGPWDFLYISWATAVSLGTGAFEAKGFAQVLEVLTTTTSIFLLTVLFGYAISTVLDDEKRMRTGNSPCEPCTRTSAPLEPDSAPDSCAGNPGPDYPRLSLLLEFLGRAKRLKQDRRRKRVYR
ncbi:MAG: hypothetical protein ACM3N0_01385 [Chloroflexota bacterium]